MTHEQATNMLKAKLECLKRETSGTDFDCNNSNCDECSFECIKRNNIQIIVDVHMLYVMEAEKVSMPERLFISPYHIACNEFSESNQDGNWEKYLFSLGIHPLQLNNSFMKGK